MFNRCQRCGGTNTEYFSKTLTELTGPPHTPCVCNDCGFVSYGKPMDLRSCIHGQHRQDYIHKEGKDLYGIEYFENMLRMYAKTAEDIATIRWKFVADVDPDTVLDYGSGVGWFRAHRPIGVHVDSYDIADVPQTGICLEHYDLVCFWDVLEHIPNFEVIHNVLDSTNHVALTVPVLPDGVKIENWKHWKPGEHLHYFSVEMLDAMFREFDFKRIKVSMCECPPRQDVQSFLFKKSH